ncbi:hypothetical protein B4N89_00615 [Embleya scabrispora]|uniref:DUF1838 domain-containing protein n=1 Tax=Embleya scabrispora TaxID=159449 RepID=A0A1T3NS76_9ACTN|nr:DUF1838 family protein [Embleya scabrispora]OPC79646.1 hypothetical protein B4N89_00615 [Embleya scabrispora]
MARKPRSTVRAALAASVATLAVAATLSGSAQAHPAPAPTDPGSLFASLSDPNARLFLQTLGRPDGRDMVFRISGSVLDQVSGNAYGAALPHGAKLFGFEGYNIRRLYRQPGTDDVYQLSREIVFYTDPVTGKRLTEWTNPLDGRTRPLPPVNNEHVNGHYRIKGGKLYSVLGTAEVPLDTAVVPKTIHDQLVWTTDAAPLYDLRTRYRIPETFGLVDNTYASWELFDFYVDRDEARARDNARQVPKGAMEVTNSWTRNGPYIPAMCIAETGSPGNLVYHARSWSLDSFDALEPWLKDIVRAEYPLYRHAPDAVDPAPNDTTWTSFYRQELAPKNVTWKQWCDNGGR